MKRYKPVEDGSGFFVGMMTGEAGEWVKHSDHESALKAAVAAEREVWNKWADAVIRDLEMRARLHNDDTIEISQGRLVELDSLRARGAAHD